MKNMTEQEVAQFDAMIEKSGATVISSLDELKNHIFDIDKLDKDGQPVITTKKPAVLITDTSVFNSSYLLDVWAESMLGSIDQSFVFDLFYLTDLETRLQLHVSDANRREELTALNIDEIEKSEEMSPCVFLVCPDADHIAAYQPLRFVPFDEKSLQQIFTNFMLFANTPTPYIDEDEYGDYLNHNHTRTCDKCNSKECPIRTKPYCDESEIEDENQN